MYQRSFYPVQIWFQSSSSSFLTRKRLIGLSGLSCPSVNRSWSEKTRAISKNSTGRPNPEVKAKQEKKAASTSVSIGHTASIASCLLRTKSQSTTFPFYFWCMWCFPRKMGEGGVNCPTSAWHQRYSPPRNSEDSIPKTNCNIHAEMLKQW